MRHTPNITHVFSGQEALDHASEQQRYNLIITSIELGDMNVLRLIEELRARGIKTPVILLAYDRRELSRYMEKNDISTIERVFLWQGDVRILLAIVKYMEDRMNVAHDTGVVGVPAIVLVEDNIRYYSSFPAGHLHRAGQPFSEPPSRRLEPFRQAHAHPGATQDPLMRSL